ncbi:RNA polymerase II transcription factor SIII subunit A-domain-containing protein [Daldinia sp. FL1419]|nr:RNA polymerase II transcription factor SIII subunit A-domain-containing protein [Daldinia sp. FL1419]
MVKSLVELCTNVCIKNIRDISNVGDLPYSRLEKILLKIDNAAQLREVEVNSPHLQGDTTECWRRLINRHFPNQVKKHHFEPRNPTLWYKIYDKYKKIETEEKRIALEKLTSSLKSIKQEKQEKASKVINYDSRLLGPAPGRRKGTGGREVAGSGGLRWGGGSRTKTTSAQSIMQKARREAAEISRRNKLMTPTGQLPVRQGQISQAPLGMREEHRIKTLPTMPAPRRTQGRIQAPQSRAGGRWEQEQKEREARLLKLKNRTTTKGATIISDDEFDDDDGFDEEEDDDVQESSGLNADYLEDLFDDDTPSTSIASRSNKIPPAPSQSKPPSDPARGSSLSGLAKMKMGLSSKNNPMRVVPVKTPTQNPASKPTASSPPPPSKPTAASPPLRPSMPSNALTSQPHTASSSSAGPGSSNADPKPKPKPVLGQKRKEPPSVFMKPKPKARRMS